MSHLAGYLAHQDLSENLYTKEKALDIAAVNDSKEQIRKGTKIIIAEVKEMRQNLSRLSIKTAGVGVENLYSSFTKSL